MDKDYLEEEDIQTHCILNRIKIVNQLHTPNLSRNRFTHTSGSGLSSYIGAKGKTKIRDYMSPRLLSQVLKGKFAIHTIFYPTHCCKMSHSS